MSTNTSGDSESTDSKLNVEQRNERTVCGKGEPVPTGSSLLSSTSRFETPEISVEGWYTDGDRPDEKIARQEVSLKFSQSDLVEEFSITTSLAPDTARELAEQLKEAAAIAEGDVPTEAIDE